MILGEEISMDPGLRQSLQVFLGEPNAEVFEAGDKRKNNGNPLAVLTGVSTNSVADQLRADGFTCFQNFALLPSAKSTRWIIPVGNPYLTLDGLSIYCPLSPRARLMKGLLLAVARIGWTGWARHKVLVASCQPLMIETLVREVTGEPHPIFALALGTPGRFRKLTVQVMRSSGEILGFIKLPLTEAATERVRAETKILRHLWGHDALQRHIPRVLYAGEWGDGYILFQSSRAHGRGPVEFGALHEEFLKVLWSVYKISRSGQELVDEVRLEWRKAEPDLPSEWRELSERVFDQSTRDLVGKMIACGLSHGDFVPWNTRLGNGPLHVFDWESATWGVPILWDMFHFHVQVATAFNKNSGWRFLSRHTRIERASFLLYLLSSVRQYLVEGGTDHAGIEYRKRILLRELPNGNKG
jgi:hypothetical protein